MYKFDPVGLAISAYKCLQKGKLRGFVSLMFLGRGTAYGDLSNAGHVQVPRRMSGSNFVVKKMSRLS